MDPSSTPLFSLIRDRLAWLNQRQRVLAQNIANADTPDFQPRDLVPFAQRVQRRGDDAGPVLLGRTDDRHIPAATSAGASFVERPMRSVYEATPTGNGVVLEEQMAMIQETATSHRLATQLYKKYLGLVRLAATSKQ